MNTSLTSPGPTISVEVGDNLILNLTSLDGNTHRWFIDYDDDTVVDANETWTRSPNFGTNIAWNITVSNVTGTFPYRSDRTQDKNAGMAWGNITISPEGTGSFLDLGIVVVGVVILAIAVVAVLVFLGRRAKSVPPPPPPDQ